MNRKIANVIITIMTCVVVMSSCSSSQEALGNGLYSYKDKATNLIGVKNKSGDIIIPAYAKDVFAQADVIVCYSTDDKGMVYKTDGEPLFYEEFDRIIDNHILLRCYQMNQMYLYVYNTHKPLGPMHKSVVTYMNNTVVLSNKFSVEVYNLSSEETRQILYNTPVGEKKSIAWMDANHRLYTGFSYGEQIYATREATGEDIRSEENMVECTSSDNQKVYGELIGKYWTFWQPSAGRNKAKMFDAPYDSWLVYDQSRKCDYLIISNHGTRYLCTLDGTVIKKIKLLEWLKIRRQSLKIGKMADLHIVCIPRLEID